MTKKQRKMIMPASVPAASLTPDEIQQLTALLQKMGTPLAPIPPRPLTVREQRARAHAPSSFAELFGVRESPAHKVQHKARHMASRFIYSAKPPKTADAYKAVRQLTPGRIAILRFLWDHPRSTVPEIAAGVPAAVKTVANALSELGLLGLVESEQRAPPR